MAVGPECGPTPFLASQFGGLRERRSPTRCIADVNRDANTSDARKGVGQGFAPPQAIKTLGLGQS